MIKHNESIFDSILKEIEYKIVQRFVEYEEKIYVVDLSLYDYIDDYQKINFILTEGKKIKIFLFLNIIK